MRDPLPFCPHRLLTPSLPIPASVLLLLSSSLTFHPTLLSPQCTRLQYRATDIIIPKPGKLELVYTPAEGGEPTKLEVFDFKSAGMGLAMYNTVQSVRDFAHASFKMALAKKIPMYMSTKNTILKGYDGQWKDNFQEIYET